MSARAPVRALEAAFRATTYQIETEARRYALRIGADHPAFDAYLQAKSVLCWGVITASNPGAVRSDADNPRRQADLLGRLQADGLAFCPALNIADAGDWPDEQAFLVLLVSEAAMRELAADFSQRAFVWGTVGGKARLIWT